MANTLPPAPVSMTIASKLTEKWVNDKAAEIFKAFEMTDDCFNFVYSCTLPGNAIHAVQNRLLPQLEAQGLLGRVCKKHSSGCEFDCNWTGTPPTGCKGPNTLEVTMATR